MFLIMVCLNSCLTDESKNSGVKKEGIPSFSFLLPDSISQLSTDSLPSDKPIVLFYFGPYCPTSRAQMEEIIKHIADLKNIEFLILTGAPFEEMISFYKHFNLNNYSNIIVARDYSNFFINYFNPQGVPYTVVYGSDRKIKEIFTGGVDIEQISIAANR